jgi:hypothetical protein
MSDAELDVILLVYICDENVLLMHLLVVVAAIS